MSLFFVFLTFFIWSTSFTLGKATLECAPPIFLTGVRMFLGGLVILSFLGLFKRDDFKIRKDHLFPLVLLSISAVYLTNVFEFWGLQYLTAAKACFIYSLSPFLSALFSYFQFKEKVSSRKLLGLIVGFIGFIPVLLNQSGAEELLGGFSFLSWAEIALIIATVTSVYGWILLRKLGKDEGMSPLMANGSSMCIGGLFALIHSLFADSWTPTPITNYSGFFQGVFLIIIISNLICYNLYGWLLKRFTATFLSFAGLMTPLFAALFGWLVLGETVSWTFFLSVAIISFGLWLVYSEELRLGYIVKRSAKKEEAA
ncbi:MAG: EamA family transporter [Chlamydiales bacterium]|nr:EamA family transporter [Chlamydiales bacterium]